MGEPMYSSSSTRGLSAACAIVASLLFAGAIGPTSSHAAGALAVALPDDVAKSGFSYGYANDKSDSDTASTRALDLCRTTKDAANDPKLRGLCKVIQNYSNQCVAVAMDPDAGTPGVGWSVADDKISAERTALNRCMDTAGPKRRAACVISHSDCDGSAQ
jgi:Domain of unknown function (DUF4189)